MDYDDGMTMSNDTLIGRKLEDVGAEVPFAAVTAGDVILFGVGTVWDADVVLEADGDRIQFVDTYLVAAESPVVVVAA